METSADNHHDFRQLPSHLKGSPTLVLGLDHIQDIRQSDGVRDNSARGGAMHWVPPTCTPAEPLQPRDISAPATPIVKEGSLGTHNAMFNSDSQGSRRFGPRHRGVAL